MGEMARNMTDRRIRTPEESFQAGVEDEKKYTRQLARESAIAALERDALAQSDEATIEWYRKRRQQVETDSIEHHALMVAAQAPPLTPTMRARLRVLLGDSAKGK